MPHSSGGGSSHRGSHHSSGGSSGSFNYEPKVRISRYYSPTMTRTWACYNMTANRMDYVYSDGKLKRSYANLLAIIAFWCFLSLCTWLNNPVIIERPEKLSWTDVKSTDIEIYDDANVLGNTAQLRQALTDFRDITGIIPVIVTVNNSQWKGYYNNLEKYTYNWYVYNFSDEKHWVIMYSEPDNYNANDKFGDWYWEGMQGDDTDIILTSSVADKFTDRLHNNFIATSRFTRTEAIIDAFEFINDKNLMASRWTETAIILILFSIFGTIHVIVQFISITKHNKQYKGYKEVQNVQIINGVPFEDACEYCNCSYIIGTISVCPHCGAAIPAHNTSKA